MCTVIMGLKFQARTQAAVNFIHGSTLWTAVCHTKNELWTCIVHVIPELYYKNSYLFMHYAQLLSHDILWFAPLSLFLVCSVWNSWENSRRNLCQRQHPTTSKFDSHPTLLQSLPSNSSLPSSLALPLFPSLPLHPPSLSFCTHLLTLIFPRYPPSTKCQVTRRTLLCEWRSSSATSPSQSTGRWLWRWVDRYWLPPTCCVLGVGKGCK